MNLESEFEAEEVSLAIQNLNSNVKQAGEEQPIRQQYL